MSDELMKACVSLSQSYSLFLKTRVQRQEAQLPFIMALLQHVASTLSRQISSSPFALPFPQLTCFLHNATLAWCKDTTFLTASCVCGDCIMLDTGSMSITPGHLRKSSTGPDSEANAQLLQEDEEHREATQKEVGCRGGLVRGCL